MDDSVPGRPPGCTIRPRLVHSDSLGIQRHPFGSIDDIHLAPSLPRPVQVPEIDAGLEQDLLARVGNLGAEGPMPGYGDSAGHDQPVAGLREVIDVADDRRVKLLAAYATIFPHLPDGHRLIIDFVLDPPAVRVSGPELPVDPVVEHEEIAVREDKRCVLSP